jgi:hypothetical protein
MHGREPKDSAQLGIKLVNHYVMCWRTLDSLDATQAPYATHARRTRSLFLLRSFSSPLRDNESRTQRGAGGALTNLFTMSRVVVTKVFFCGRPLAEGRSEGRRDERRWRAGRHTLLSLLDFIC